MAIRPPAIDDRSFLDLVEDLVARIPAHTPEWTNPRLGDPGVTVLELVAWLADTMLYRANLIPERQRLVFLSLLGMQPRAAMAARGLVSLSIEGEQTAPLAIAPFAKLDGPSVFETSGAVNVFPLEAGVFAKRALTAEESGSLRDVLEGLREVYNIRSGQTATPYRTEEVFTGGRADAAGFDVIRGTVDKAIWIALFAKLRRNTEAAQLVEEGRNTLGKAIDGRQPSLSIGVVPSIVLRNPMPESDDDLAVRDAIPFVWEITRQRDGKLEYLGLDVIEDTTRGLTGRGIMRVLLPAPDKIGRPENDVRADLFSGVGNRPPRIEDLEKASRLVTWLRLRPLIALESLPVTWMGINSVEIEQRTRLTPQVIGAGTGQPDQQMRLPAGSVELDGLRIEVEEEQGPAVWRPLESLAFAGRDEAAFELDTQTGDLRFGDGMRGRIPAPGARVRAAAVRTGGGSRGNLPAGSLKSIEARQLDGSELPAALNVLQPVATDGGADEETVVEAERRIPAYFRHHDRVVTEEDYRRLAATAPGARVGRVEVLPRFLPQQRRRDVPGVVSIMALPFQSRVEPPNPRPDRPFLETIDRFLKPRRPVATELYVIGCEYVALGLSVGITVRDGFNRDAVALAARDALRGFLWPLAPGGPSGEGWPLGRRVREREIEAVTARVAGIDTVAGSTLFVETNKDWKAAGSLSGNNEVILREWQLPELLSVIVATDGTVPSDLSGLPNPFGDEAGLAVPVVPEVC